MRIYLAKVVATFPCKSSYYTTQSEDNAVLKTICPKVCVTCSSLFASDHGLYNHLNTKVFTTVNVEQMIHIIYFPPDLKIIFSRK